MDTGESITIAHLVTIGSSEFRNSALQVDGSSVTPKYAGGSAPTEEILTQLILMFTLL